MSPSVLLLLFLPLFFLSRYTRVKAMRCGVFRLSRMGEEKIVDPGMYIARFRAVGGVLGTEESACIN